MGITFLDQTDEPTAGTPIQFLSPRSLPSLAGTLIRFLSPVSEPAAGIVPVGSKATTGSPSANTQMACTLPPGCQAGDVAVLSCTTQQYITLAPPASWSTAAAPVNIGAGVNTFAVAVYLYTLTQADVDAGTLGVSYTTGTASNGQASVLIDAYRGVSESALDVVGAVVKGANPTSPATVTAAGVTTARDGDLLQCSLFDTNFGSLFDVAPPSGWVVGDSPSLASGAQVTSAHIAQATAGATGDVPVSFDYNFDGSTEYYAIVLLSLRRAVPAITLTHTLPTPQVGVAYTGSITATNMDGATGAITLTPPTGIPDGLTVGARTGSGPYTWPITGTPTTAGAFSAPFDFSNGTQSASYAWADTVQAAGTVPSVVQSANRAAHSASPSATLGVAPTPGNYLVFAVYAVSAPSSGPPGFTPYPDCTGNIGGRNQAVYYRQVQAADGATYAMTLASAGDFVAALVEVKDVTSGLSSGALAKDAAQLTIPAGVTGALPLVFTGASAIGYSEQWQTPAGFVLIDEQGYSSTVGLAWFAGIDASTGAPISVSPIGFVGAGWQIASGLLIK